VCSPEELERRRRLIARARAQTVGASAQRDTAALQAEAAARVQRAREAADAAAYAAARDRERDAPRLASPHDPGPVKPAWRREGTAPSRSVVVNQITEQRTEAGNSAAESASTSQPHVISRRRGKLRPWKAPRRKPLTQPSAAVLAFAKEHAWTEKRSQALATRIKKNDATIAHPRSAEAAWRRLPLYLQAGARRAMHASGWTWADEAARRHVAFLCTLDDFSRPSAWQRPRQLRSSRGMPTRYRGMAKFALAVVGWTQTALALTISGPATTDAGADPVDPKTVQRHTALAEQYSGIQRVVRNPDAPAELRGRATPTNPRGWPINQYWIPSPDMMKPGFTGAVFDSEGQPIALEEALALELVPRAKRPRRLREAALSPPPLA
jgi:hypothetical protein